MKHLLSIGALLALSALAGGTAAAQRLPLRGVVWQEPQELQHAVAELYAMRRAGVQAVRTGLIRNERLFGVADQLGLQLFQELPVQNIAAGNLRDSLRSAARMLDSALVRSRRHRSARHFGLARQADTSSPVACAYFRGLAGRVRRTIPGARTYYVTTFIESDACAGAVDFVLLQAPDTRDPLRVLRRWYERGSSPAARPAQPRPAGLATLGTWVQEGTERGWRVPHSPEAQARYLETHLTRLFDAADSLQTYAVFVYRWRDVAPGREGGITQDEAAGRSYGLRGARGARPALNVLSGLYTGRQTVFAFDAGEEPKEGSSPWRTLFGWGGVLLLGVLYAASPRLRFMMPRYFSARGFYRDAIREGRDVLLGSSAALLTVVALTSGLVWSAFVEQLARADSYLPMLGRLPGFLRSFIVWLEGASWAGVLFLALVYALGIVAWSVVLATGSRRRYALSPTQTLMLAVWPRWPVMFLLPVAIIVPALPHAVGFQVALWMLTFWLLITLYAMMRTVYDYAQVTRVPFLFSMAAFLLNPLILFLVLLGLGAIVNTPNAAFLYHLLTRT